MDPAPFLWFLITLPVKFCCYVSNASFAVYSSEMKLLIDLTPWWFLPFTKCFFSGPVTGYSCSSIHPSSLPLCFSFRLSLPLFISDTYCVKSGIHCTFSASDFQLRLFTFFLFIIIIFFIFFFFFLPMLSPCIHLCSPYSSSFFSHTFRSNYQSSFLQGRHYPLGHDGPMFLLHTHC